MWPLIILIVVFVFVALAVFAKTRITDNISESDKSDLPYKTLKRSSASLAGAKSDIMNVRFNNLAALTDMEEFRLVEVKDKNLLAKIDNVVPGTLQTLANTKAINSYKHATKSIGQLYQAIIPKGAVLDKSRTMEGAVRGSYRQVPNRIQGNANWLPVEGNTADSLAKMGAVNGIMNVASMVVGQYYMSQINNQLEDISADIEKISDFQQNEFKSKVYALVAEVQKSSTFQVEIMENNEMRNRELAHIKSLEHECAQLLGQANLSLQDISGKKDLDYDEYEKKIGEAEIWYQYQQIFLQVMCKLSELTYTMNAGEISRKNSNALLMPYVKQTDTTLEKLNGWHSENVERLKIDIEESRRKRQGIEGFFMSALGFFDDDFNYKKIPERTVLQIGHQSDNSVAVKTAVNSELFQEDVRLIAKDGKLYYLPQQQS